MQFLFRVEKSWRVTRFGVFAIFVTFVVSLWLATYFLNELKWILKSEEAEATQQAYERGYIRAASGDIHNDSTPESTMQAFVDALRQEDIDGALTFVSERFREEARSWFSQFEIQGGDFSALSEYILGMKRRESLLGDVEYYRSSLKEGYPESVIFMQQDSDGEWRLTFSLY